MISFVRGEKEGSRKQTVTASNRNKLEGSVDVRTVYQGASNQLRHGAGSTTNTGDHS